MRMLPLVATDLGKSLGSGGRTPRAPRDRQRRTAPAKRPRAEINRRAHSVAADPARRRRLVELLVDLLDERQSNTPR